MNVWRRSLSITLIRTFKHRGAVLFFQLWIVLFFFPSQHYILFVLCFIRMASHYVTYYKRIHKHFHAISRSSSFMCRLIGVSRTCCLFFSIWFSLKRPFNFPCNRISSLPISFHFVYIHIYIYLSESSTSLERFSWRLAFASSDFLHTLPHTANGTIIIHIQEVNCVYLRSSRKKGVKMKWSSNRVSVEWMPREDACIKSK